MQDAAVPADGRPLVSLRVFVGGEQGEFDPAIRLSLN
jgi:hypothetical protein